MAGELIGVTGASGHLGGAVARELARDGIPMRLVCRDPARAPALPGAQVAVAAYGRTAEAVSALRGVSTLFMVSATESATRLAEHTGFIDAAVEAGVRHVVYTSFFRAAPDAVFTLARDHWATEEHLRAAGLASTMLRDNLYLDVLRYFVVDGVMRGPAGDGRVSAVARADVARVALAVLRDPGAHAAGCYDLTGPEAITMAEACAVIAEATGRPARFENETLEQAYRSRARWDPQPWQADAWVSTYSSIASGDLAAVTDDVERLTGRPPLSLRKVLEAAGSARRT
ncbi:MAG: SDR family oxidoreductase [Dermatophilaceae bacterium]